MFESLFDVEAWRDQIPTGDRLYSLIGLLLIAILGVGLALYAILRIMPEAQNRAAAIAQVTQLEQNLAAQEQIRDQVPETLRRQIASTQTSLTESLQALMTEAQAAATLNNLYQYASRTGVTIVALENRPNPQSNIAPAVDVRGFSIQAQGTLPALLNFGTTIEEASASSFVITKLTIEEGEAGHLLSMDILLYTSSLATGATSQSQPAEGNEGVVTELAQSGKGLLPILGGTEWGKAIALLSQAVQSNPTEDLWQTLSGAYLNYGYELLAQGDLTTAAAQFQAVLEKEPNSEAALTGLDQILAISQAALSPAEKVLQLLESSQSGGDWQEAINLLLQLEVLDPTAVDTASQLYTAYVNYGTQLAAAGQPEAAKLQYTQALMLKAQGTEAQAGLQSLAGGGVVPAPVVQPTAPSAPPTALPAPTALPLTVTYVVQAGDTLYAIADRYGSSVPAIMQINGLQSTTIYAGLSLTIPR